MQNEEGKNVDLYIPRKCSWTNRLIGAQDHASVQLNVAKVDASGMYTGQSHAFALAGYIRAKVSSLAIPFTQCVRPRATFLLPGVHMHVLQSLLRFPDGPTVLRRA